jgi:hypothetical protein
MKAAKIVTISSLLMLYTTILNAAVLLDNTSSNVDAFLSGGFSNPIRHAISFRTGSTAYVLNSVTILPMVSNTAQSGQITFALYEADSTGTPTNAITSVTQTGTFAVRSQANSSNYSTSSLDNTFVVKANSYYPDTPYSVGSSGLTYLGRAATSSNTWESFRPVNNALFKLTGTIFVPEPSTYALAITSSLLLLGFARYRDRKHADR